MRFDLFQWHKELLGAPLKPGEFKAMVATATFATGTTGLNCYPSADQVAELSGLKTSVVYSAWKKAEGCGLITKTPRRKWMRCEMALVNNPALERAVTTKKSKALEAEAKSEVRSDGVSFPQVRSVDSAAVIIDQLIEPIHGTQGQEQSFKSSSTSHTESPMPIGHPSDGGANHEEYEMTDDDRRPSDTDDKYSAGPWVDTGIPIDQICDDIDRMMQANEPSGNSGQLPRRPISAEYLDAADAILAESGFAVAEQSSRGLEHLPTRVNHMPSAGNMVADIKHLRAETGLPIHACKTALEDAHGDLAAATVALKRHKSYIEPLEHRTTPGPHHITSAAQMREDLARPVPQFKGCIPASETIAMTGYERVNQVDVLTHRERWKQVAGRHWKGPWDAWLNQFLPYMTDDQHQAWMAAVLKADNVPNMPWNTTTVIGIMSGEKRQQRGKGYGGGQR